MFVAKFEKFIVNVEKSCIELNIIEKMIFGAIWNDFRV